METKLFLGDCMDILKTLESESVDMVFSDLPYGTTRNKWDSVIPLQGLWVELKRVRKSRCACVFTASQPFTSILGASNIEELRYSWIWEKTNGTGHLNAHRMPMKNFEDILVFYKSQPVYNPQGLVPLGKTVRRGHNGTSFGDSGKENFQEFTNYPRAILRFGYDKEKLHPTQKPVALMEYLIKTYSNAGDAVLDCTMGSGSTGVACKNLNRGFIGIEKEEKYFQITKERLNYV